jgi:hypothetical protein
MGGNPKVRRDPGIESELNKVLKENTFYARCQKGKQKGKRGGFQWSAPSRFISQGGTGNQSKLDKVLEENAVVVWKRKVPFALSQRGFQLRTAKEAKEASKSPRKSQQACRVQPSKPPWRAKRTQSRTQRAKRTQFVPVLVDIMTQANSARRQLSQESKGRGRS